MSSPTRAWKHGARTAIIVSVLLEVWAEDKSPTYFPRTTLLKPGLRDFAARQWSQFGVEEGVFRLLGILARHRVHATFFTSGIVGELYPEVVRQIMQEGHAVAGHGYSQDQFLLEMPVQEQRATIRKCLDILENTAGQRPDGWCTPVYSWTADTADHLVQEGLVWHADALDGTLPRRQLTKSGSIIAIPWVDFVDNRVLRSSPRDYLEVYTDTFDYIHAQEEQGLLHIGIHCHFGGRPLMSAVFNKVLDYIAQRSSSVWMATHRELADYTIEHEPMPPKQRLLCNT